VLSSRVILSLNSSKVNTNIIREQIHCRGTWETIYLKPSVSLIAVLMSSSNSSRSFVECITEVIMSLANRCLNVF
jgi:hypothetical protein